MVKQCALTILGLQTALSSCVTSKGDGELPPIGPKRCAHLMGRIDWDDQLGVLNHVSRLMKNACYAETVAVGTQAREDFRHKNYSILKESAELFIAEGAVTDYVLESYERGYLTFLISVAYLKQGKRDAAQVELNRLYHEEVAAIYNHGQDPINALLQAVLWESSPREGFSSRPFWLWLTESEGAQPELRQFAQRQLKRIDAKEPGKPWQIKAVADFPRLDWSISFPDPKTGYFQIIPQPQFLQPCLDDNGILVPTTSWFQKIAIRHSHDYHPLVNAKTWIRLPVGVVYGISTVMAGAGIMVGGCSLDVAVSGSGHKTNGALCKLSVEGGLALAAQSGDVIEATLRPDLRHWVEVPQAIFVSAAPANTKEGCGARASAYSSHRFL